MLSEKERRHTDEELIAEFNATGIDKQYFSLFKKIYDESHELSLKCNIHYSDDEYGENESDRIHTFDATIFILLSEYIPCLEMGHSEEWAFAMVKSSCYDLGWNMYFAFQDIKKFNPQLAKDEILNYCKYINADEHFVRYFLSLFMEMEMHDCAIEVAHRYSEIYKKQIGFGKSQAYSDKYAELKASEKYNELYCVIQALFNEEFSPEV